MPVSDQQQREQALDISQSFIVQAPAGSGKTGVLTLRILKLLATVDEPEDILAITFTKKAAAEMRVRVMEALELADGPPPSNPYELQFHSLGREVLQRDRERDWGLKQNQNRLRLLTIDSFCSSIVKNRPLASGLGVQFSIAEDASDLYVEAARELLTSLDSDDELGTALRRVLGNLDNQFTKLSNLVTQMLAQRDHWLADVSAVHGEMDRFRMLLEASLLNLNNDSLEAIREHINAGFFPELDQICIYARNQLQAQQLSHPLNRTSEDSITYIKEQLKLLLTSKMEPRSRFTKNDGFPSGNSAEEKKEAKSYKLRVKELVEQIERSGSPGLMAIRDFISLPDESLSGEQWQLLEDLVQIMRYAAAHLKLVFQAQHCVDFSEVALAALATLGTNEDPTDVTLLLDNKINHILVDEFQDTSFIQVELLDRLTGGWEHNDGRTLFLVGDPMQSIYAFRKADVGLFLRLWHSTQLGHVALTPLTLTSNFRSSETVIDWVNSAFSRIFPKHADIRKGAVRYSESIANKPAGETDCVTINLFCHEKEYRQSANNEEANWIAEQIASLPEQESVAILVKGKAHVGHIVPLLNQAGIPYQAVDIESLSQSQIITDLLSAARAYLSPCDKVAWFALMRGPWIGLTLKDLTMLNAVDSNPWSALQQLQEIDALPPSTIAKLSHLRSVFEAAYHDRHRDSWALSLRNIVLALGIPASTRNQADLQSIELFFGLLESIDSIADVPDFQVLRKKLDDLFVPPEIYPSNTRVVQVMTMHKSKGLEFDTVFLPQLHRKPRVDDKPLILVDKQTAIADEAQELFLAPFEQRHEKNSNTVYAHLWRLQRQRTRNEAARLLYVASTRAKKRLLLSGCIVKDNGEAKSPDAQSLLAFIHPDLTDLEFVEHDVHTVEPAMNAQYFRTAGDTFLTAILNQKKTEEITESPNETKLVYEEEQGDHVRRFAGTLTHRILEMLAKSPALYGTLDPDQYSESWSQELSRMGVPEERIIEALNLVIRAIRNVQQSEHGKWLFSALRETDQAELSLMHNAANTETRQLIVDRTFVEDNTRYIIDYKLSEPAAELTSFLQQEVTQYRPQLLGYWETMNAVSPMPTKLFLYFPLIDHLEEVVVTCP